MTWQPYAFFALMTLPSLIIALVVEYSERKHFAEFKRRNNIK